MKYYEEIISLPALPAGFPLLSPEQIPMIFDIETTGLSPKSAFVYLIGSLTWCNTHWLFRQWFSESPSEEISVLEAFASTVTEAHCLLHYNGATFDLPFLAARSKHYGLPLTLPSGEMTCDLMRILAKCKDWFALPNRKQSTLEPIAGYVREDPYDGGTLIGFYAEYVGKCRFDKEASDALLASLLLHNREDLLGLRAVAGLYNVQRLLSGEYGDCTPVATMDNDSLTITLSFSIDAALPTPLALEYRYDPLTPEAGATDNPATPISQTMLLFTQGNNGQILLPLRFGVGKHYFSNVKDYYYLPLENRSIHRSITGHIPAAYRTPATKDTAFETYTGHFLPQWNSLYTPEFQGTRTSPVLLFPYQELTKQPQKLSAYVSDLLRKFGESGTPSANIHSE